VQILQKESLAGRSGRFHFLFIATRKEREMKKTIAIALTTVTMLGMAAPAFAGALGDGSSDMRDLKAWSIMNALQNKGINATLVEEHGDNVLAFITTADGKQKMEIFNPSTLQPVAN